MAVSDEQSVNEAAPISVTVLGIVTLLIDVQPENANELIVETESEITSSVISVPLRNNR